MIFSINKLKACQTQVSNFAHPKLAHSHFTDDEQVIDTRSKPNQLKKRLRKIHETDSENEEAKPDDAEDGKTVEQL